MSQVKAPQSLHLRTVRTVETVVRPPATDPHVAYSVAIHVRPGVKAATVASMTHFLGADKPIDHPVATDGGPGQAGESFQVPAEIFLHNEDTRATLAVSVKDLGSDAPSSDERTEVEVAVRMNTGTSEPNGSLRTEPLDRHAQDIALHLVKGAATDAQRDLMYLLDEL